MRDRHDVYAMYETASVPESEAGKNDGPCRHLQHPTQPQMMYVHPNKNIHEDVAYDYENAAFPTTINSNWLDGR